MLERSGTFWFVAILIVVLFGITNLPWHLDNYDQAKQAFTSFEMVNQGHWIYEHTPNEKIATKPPLVGWTSAAIYGVLRSWEIAWHLPSLAAALLLLVVLTRSASHDYGVQAGLLAMAAFGLNLLSPRLATLVRTDMPLALIVFLLGLQIWEKLRRAEAWNGRDRMVAFVLLTAAMLIKGPIVYAFLLPGLVVFQLRFRKSDIRVSAWCGWWPWLVSLAIFLVWAGAGIAWVPGFYDQVVVREFAGRFGETMHRSRPLYFYWPHLLHKFAPWSLLMIGLAILGWRTEKAGLRARWQRLSPDVLWLVCWAFGGLILMSLIPSKRVDRIFPSIAPLCLLLAAQFAALDQNETLTARMRFWSGLALALSVLMSVGYVGEKIFSGYRSHADALAQFGAAVRKSAAPGSKYEVIGGKEEGLLLYLRRPRFVRPKEAVEQWNSGTLDALVVPAEESGELMKALPGATANGLEGAVTINGEIRRYLLLTKKLP